ncbi:O-methyltransferase [Colletotrichum zoysiae]|uniref:O-methyltransferase n=1 Tax=Colletotrichum zoysiae TaxID=1216348 RepID=A0AAD9H5M7_9PEZI|nr:O-methyltransferase [Colletotrichum zoysiae]
MAPEADHGSDAVRAFLDAANGIPGSITNEDDRNRVLLKLYELVGKVESPWDTFVRVYMTEPTVKSVLKVLRDVRIFERWRKNGNSPMTAVELAGLADGFDPALLQRLLRVLVANNLVEMSSDEKYKPTGFCVKFAESDFNIAAKFFEDFHVPINQHLPTFLAETGYKNPAHDDTSAFDSAFGGDGGMFKYLTEHPEAGEVFNVMQRTSTSNLARWTSIYPSDALVDEADPQLPLLVDVGGSIGQDVQNFLEAHPGTASRVYLEDLPAVIADENSTLVHGVNKVPYDFFTPQPIKHARAYYLHHIIHDWPNEQARKILEMQKAAMKPGYSRLLLHDYVLRDDGPDHPHAAVSDMLMMTFCCAYERTEREWESLLASAGLGIVKIWRVPFTGECVIEAELAPEVNGVH